MSVHWHTAENTTWPVDVDGEQPSVEWALRYNGGVLSKTTLLSAASVMAAYRSLTDPSITQADAIAQLKRARSARLSCGGAS